MAKINNILEGLWNVRIVLCVLAFSLPILVAIFLMWRRRRSASIPYAYCPRDMQLHVADGWLTPNSLFDDRRRSMRRNVSNVEVRIHKLKIGPPYLTISGRARGIVMDCSLHGVGLAVAESYPIGSILNIMPKKAPSAMPWAQVTVRNCEPIEDYFKIGCEFNEKLPWNELLLFG